jgi:hypothetical protein
MPRWSYTGGGTYRGGLVLSFYRCGPAARVRVSRPGGKSDIAVCSVDPVQKKLLSVELRDATIAEIRSARKAVESMLADVRAQGGVGHRP